MQILLTTTGVEPNVILTDMGERTFVHPTTDYNLLSEFRVDNLFGSESLQLALTNGYITLKDQNDNSITDIQKIHFYGKKSDDVNEGTTKKFATVSQKQALDAANSPSTTNYFLTKNDIVFGSEYFYREKTTSQSTASSTFQTYDTLTEAVLGGTYRVETTFVWSYGSTSTNFGLDVTIDGVSMLTSALATEPQDSSSSQRFYNTITRDVALSAGNRSIAIKFKSDGATTASLYYACIRVIRVS